MTEEKKVHEVFLDIIKDYPLRYLCERTGMRTSSISSWRYQGHIPTLTTASKVLEALGYEIKIVKTENIDEGL